MNPTRCLLAVCAVLAALAPLAAAQVAVQGRHAPLPGNMAPAAVTVNADGERVQRFAAVPFFELPYQDNELLLLLDQAERTRSSALTRMALPYKFAEPVAVYVDFMASALATTLPNGDRVLRWGVRSTGALSLSVLFDQFRLPRGAEFYVHNEHETLGAFTAEVNNKEHLNFAVRPIAGEYLMLEYFEPAGLVYDVEPAIVVSEVVHGFKSIFNTAASGACNINAVCKSNFEPQISSVGMLLTDSLSRYCSGSLVNNARGDGRQLFLTANHCMGSSPTKHIIMFNYQTPTCTGGTAPTKDTVQGLTILGQYDNSDFALLEVQERIPDSYNVYLNGISAVNTAPVDPVCVHHPAGDVKKITVFNGTAVDDCWSECPKQYHWRIPAWTEGTTEGGSSGSPLFDGKTRYVVGQLHGGSASCYNTKGYDAYGKVANSWDTATAAKQRLRDVLDPLNTGVLEIPGISLAAARSARTN